MARPIITDKTEVARWVREGKTYQEMADIYAERGIEVSPAAFASLRYRMGLPKKQEWHRELIPWTVKAEHRWDTMLNYLRTEGQRRRGDAIPANRLKPTQAFFKNLDREDLVIHYDPDTKTGFWLIPREDFDEDFIREPDNVPEKFRT